MSITTAFDYRRHVLPDRVHASVYTDPAVFEDELTKIWYRTWVFVGHESEVARPGDQVCKHIGPREVILRRELDGAVGVEEAARVDSYRGFVFASIATDGPTLLEHLGEASREIDRLADLSPVGEVEITTGWLHHRTEANWKLVVENETDGYHPQFVHGSVFAATDSPIGALYTERSHAVNRALGGGHSELDLRPEFRRIGVPMGWFGTTEDRLPGYVSQMRELHGPDADRLLIEGAPHVMVFPNLFIAEVSIFDIQPVSVNRTVQHVTAVQLRGAPDLNRRMLSQCVGSVGPAGLLLADDTEMYERNHAGLRNREPAWLDMRRGIHRERTEATGTRAGAATDEASMRGFWEHYLTLIEG